MPDAAAWELVKKSISASCQLFDGHLSEVDKADWFRMPTEGVTHVAWQAGHIAISTYGIGLRLQRGERPADAELGLTNYKELFGQGSTPSADASIYPSAEELHATIKKVFAQVDQEMVEWPLSDLDSALDPPHPRFKTRFEFLAFLPAHNFMHFGQVSLLRRLFGNAPLR
ncbi:DinB family protein [Blastopirellula sp. J2-11]|uniref:DinB family protein n=1 Tax=Blastopirellula sp. J2-11 TaxID=2943192 RepID=UPI0021C74F5A|nr:DinB family protein [Blastopirellula sp. J2-11]UUO07311.1 DinB family protein [Blastopirellula sp. J2-11]